MSVVARTMLPKAQIGKVTDAEAYVVADDGCLLDRPREALVVGAKGVAGRRQTGAPGQGPANVSHEKRTGSTRLRPAGKDM